MSENQLTKDAERLLVLMYRAYLNRRKGGLPKVTAKQMGSSQQIHEQLLPDSDPLDITETCQELSRAGYLSTLIASNRIICSYLTDQAIAYMENRFKNGLKDILAFLSQFVP